MPRTAFDRELRRLHEKLMALGGMVEETLTESVRILKEQDEEAARRFIAADAVLNHARYDIENDALVLMATQQPMAGDLRSLASILEIATELERIGDYAKGIAKTGLDVKVLGPGCSQCDKLEVAVMEVMNELNLPGSVEHVRDVREIARFGVMGVPALVINGKVFAVGSVPPKNRIKTWLQEARA